MLAWEKCIGVMNNFVPEQDKALLEVSLPLIIKLRDPFLRAKKTWGGPQRIWKWGKQALAVARGEEGPNLGAEGSA